MKGLEPLLLESPRRPRKLAPTPHLYYRTTAHRKPDGTPDALRCPAVSGFTYGSRRRVLRLPHYSLDLGACSRVEDCSCQCLLFRPCPGRKEDGRAYILE